MELIHRLDHMLVYKHSDSIYDKMPDDWMAIEGQLFATKRMHESGIVMPIIQSVTEKVLEHEGYACFEDLHGFPTRNQAWPYASDKVPSMASFNSGYNGYHHAISLLKSGMRGNIKFIRSYSNGTGSFPSEHLTIDHFLGEVRLSWYPNGDKENLKKISLFLD